MTLPDATFEFNFYLLNQLNKYTKKYVYLFKESIYFHALYANFLYYFLFIKYGSAKYVVNGDFRFCESLITFKQIKQCHSKFGGL